MPRYDVLVVGAGLSGLTVARSLAAHGKRILVVDKGRSVGGRLATRRIGEAVLDHGAQFFTSRSKEFTEAVASWQSDGVVGEWCRGFAEPDGFPRYRTHGGMNQLAEHLAAGLPDSATVVTSLRARSATRLGDRYEVHYDGRARDPDEATGLVITSPVPQSLALLDAGGIILPGAQSDGLRAIRYHPVIALLTTLGEAAPFGAFGALQRPDDPIFTFCADNQTKGISGVPAATFHTAHALSAELFDLSDAEILQHLRPEAELLLEPARIRSIQVKKWRFAGPVEPWPDRCALISSGSSPLVLCGDAFGGPRIEGAYLSGLAAARAILTAGD